MSHYTAIAYFTGNSMAEQSADFDAKTDIHSAKVWAMCKAKEGLTGVVYQDGQYMGEYDPADPVVRNWPMDEEPKEQDTDTDYPEYQVYANQVRTSGYPLSPMPFAQWQAMQDVNSLIGD